MEEKKEVASTPSVNEETKKVMDDMRAQGHTFEGDPEKEPEKKPEPEIKPEVEPKVEPKEPEKEPREPEIQPSEAELHPERKPREPKQIPAWQAEVDKKHLQKEWEEKSVQEQQKLRDEIATLQSKVKELTGVKKEEAIGEWIDKIVVEKGLEVDTEFLKNFADEILKRIPKSEMIPDISKTLETVSKIEAKTESEREDSEYKSSFDKEIVPKLKEEYPQILDDEVNSIREAMRKPYFSERFITLSAGEIYALTSGSYKDLVAPERRPTVEKGTKGAGRGQMKDYANLTEEEYKNLTPEELAEVNKFLLHR